MAVRRPARPVMDPSAGRSIEPVSQPASSTPVPRTPTTRITVDLSREDHRALRRTTEDMADELDRGRVPIQQVMAALAHRITVDQELRQSVIQDLRTHRSQ